MAWNARSTLGLITLMASAGVAQAECVSAKCSNQITIFLVMAAGFALLAIVLVVMLIRPKWRKEGLILLALSLAVFAGIPLASQGWMAQKRAAMERREILGQPPAMADRTPLVITRGSACDSGPCKSVLRGRGGAGAYVIPLASLDGFDLTKPIPLADLPLEFQSFIPLGGQRVSRFLTEAERRDVARQIDYVILIGPYLEGYRSNRSTPNHSGAIDHLLRGNPALAGQTEHEFVQLAMAPIDPASGALSLADLQFDLLELWFFGYALAVPLGPDSWTQQRNTKATTDLAAQSLCLAPDDTQDWFCAEGLK